MLFPRVPLKREEKNIISFSMFKNITKTNFNFKTLKGLVCLGY